MSTPKLNDSDVEKLKDHVRFLHGLRTTEQTSTAADGSTAAATTTTTPARRRSSTKSSIASKVNRTYTIRRECIKKRMGNWAKKRHDEIRELQVMQESNLRKRKGDLFKLNKAFHMRWRKIRGLPVVHSHFRDVFLDTGKPPFVVPVHYKPFDVYWDADWTEQEFIFLDPAEEEKEKDENGPEKKRKKEEEEKRKLSERSSQDLGGQLRSGDVGNESYTEAKMSDVEAPKVSN